MKHLIIITFILITVSAYSQQQREPNIYRCERTDSQISIDGDINEAGWQQAAFSELFQDIEGDKKPMPKYDTRIKMLYDNEFLYVAAWMVEPHLCGWIENDESVIFYDNDFEIFMDFDHDGLNYREWEINTLGTAWDLMLTAPYRSGGQPLTSYNLTGIKYAVKAYGTINDPSDVDSCWTVEVAIPIRTITEGRLRRYGNIENKAWRINFSRVEWDYDVVDGEYKKAGNPEHNWVWSPQKTINMHKPEYWGWVWFAPEDIKDTPTAEDLNPLWEERIILCDIFEAIGGYRKTNKALPQSLEDLKVDIPEGVKYHLEGKIFRLEWKEKSCMLNHKGEFFRY